MRMSKRKSRIELRFRRINTHLYCSAIPQLPTWRRGPGLISRERVSDCSKPQPEVSSGTDPAGLSIIRNRLTPICVLSGAEPPRNRSGSEAICSSLERDCFMKRKLLRIAYVRKRTRAHRKDGAAARFIDDQLASSPVAFPLRRSSKRPGCPSSLVDARDSGRLITQSQSASQAELFADVVQQAEKNVHGLTRLRGIALL